MVARSSGLCSLAALAGNLLPRVAAQSGGIQTGLSYGSNWVPVTKDSELVAQNFPDVDIELLSPAFLNPEGRESGFANGTSGPTSLTVMDNFLRILADRNEWMTYESVDFLSEEGRNLPYVYLSLPSPSNQPRLRVYMQAAIHGNEPSADEAGLAFLGKMDANQTWARSVLEKMDIRMLPRYNVDGVAYFQRQLANNLDPNREHIKLMKQQSRDIKRRLTSFDPHIAIDLHEYTAPSVFGGVYQHGSDALLSGGINPNIHPAIRSEVLDKFIPAMGEALESHGLRWEHYVTGATNTTRGSAIRLGQAVTEARTGRNAAGLGQTISFLLETRGIRLADQHFQRRVATQLVKIETILNMARDRFDEVYKTVEDARAEFVSGDDDIVVTDYFVPENRTFTFIDRDNGSVVKAPVQWQRTTPSVANLTRARPEAYIIPRTWYEVAERLEILGLEVQRLGYVFNQTVEALNVTSSSLARTLYEGHVLNTVTTGTYKREVVLPVGSFRVSTRQKNAALAFIALEPENIDSYVTFNIIPLKVGEEYPIFRIPKA
ncbi:hypothetical protein PspLS_11336 [Pyricularia sp. CBS 133598]|nr:hypothetical protein PspLS_11336 [Pyricularia sp. CBS 133598]